MKTLREQLSGYISYIVVLLLAATMILLLIDKPYNNGHYTMTIIFLLTMTFALVLYKYIKTKLCTIKRLQQLNGYQKALENTSYFAKIDTDYNIIYANNSFRRLFNFNNERNFVDLLKHKTIDTKFISNFKMKIEEKSEWEDIIDLKLNNTECFLNFILTPIETKGNALQEYLFIANDLTELIQAKKELTKQLSTDFLTNLPNRFKFVEDFNALPKENRSLIYLNIDNFGTINEFFGMQTGNCLLKHVSAWLSRKLPSKDAVLYKFELDNFAIFIKNPISETELRNYLKLISSDIVKERFVCFESEIDITFTMGVAQGTKDLLKYSYLASKHAKKEKKSYSVFKSHKINETIFMNNIKINRMIKKAIDEKRVVPFFQPIHNIEKNQVERFETLMRIQNSDNTFQQPKDFLEIAKKSKLYPELTIQMMEKSFEILEKTGHQITLNISIEDILNKKVSEFILSKLALSQLGHLISFEIVESDKIENNIAVKKFIKRVKSLGCKIAIDDFGTGYSNFEQLLQLNVDVIKIDGSLIKDIDKNRESEIVVKTIITFARELGIQTVAEYVRSYEVFDKVKSLGIDYAQGYYLGKPQPLI